MRECLHACIVGHMTNTRTNLDIIRAARDMGITVNGGRGLTFLDIRELLEDAEAPIPFDEDGSLAYERYLENRGWEAARWDEERELARSPFGW